MEDDRRLFVPGAKSIPIRIAGVWDANTWSGTVGSDEELACLALVRTPYGINWFRSRRSGPDGMALRIWIGSQPETGEHWFTVELGGAFCPGRFDGAIRSKLIEEDPGIVRQTGHICWLKLSVNPELPPEIGLLALAKSDVQFRRKRIWRLRTDLQASLTDELRLMLVDRRYGVLPNT
jgi:hypothetical protein